METKFKPFLGKELQDKLQEIVVDVFSGYWKRKNIPRKKILASQKMIRFSVPSINAYPHPGLVSNLFKAVYNSCDFGVAYREVWFAEFYDPFYVEIQKQEKGLFHIRSFRSSEDYNIDPRIFLEWKNPEEILMYFEKILRPR